MARMVAPMVSRMLSPAAAALACDVCKAQKGGIMGAGGGRRHNVWGQARYWRCLLLAAVYAFAPSPVLHSPALFRPHLCCSQVGIEPSQSRRHVLRRLGRSAAAAALHATNGQVWGQQ